nr:caspase 3 apoptosis cysteine peptidase [Hymenolepis microstoma]
METQLSPSQTMSSHGDEGDASFQFPTHNVPTICPNPPTLSKSIGSPEASLNVDSWRYIAESELSDPDLAYPRVLNPNNRSNPRGVCLLINQRDFDQAKTGQERRDGTDIDADIVERTFIKCGYAVNRATNLTLRKMEYLLDDVRNQNHSKYDSFVCVLLSHGCEGMVFASDGTINVDRLISYFRSDRCPTLAGKPKMFFIQACRGSKFDRGFALSTDASSEGMLITKMPIEADVFVANSTFPGYYAWRNSHTGSWFIQELCKVIKADQDLGKSHDVAALLTVVARKVAILYESNTGQADSHASKQMVSVNSTLTRKAYLF